MKTLVNIKIVEMQTEDWPWVKNIYEEGIATKYATFETELPEWTEWYKNHFQE